MYKRQVHYTINSTGINTRYVVSVLMRHSPGPIIDGYSFFINDEKTVITMYNTVDIIDQFSFQNFSENSITVAIEFGDGLIIAPPVASIVDVNIVGRNQNVFMD